MGPQLCSCGNPSFIVRNTSDTSSLQWGRNFAVAETALRIAALTEHIALQWGRNFAVAETA